jgi:hypothetical protein
LKAVRAAADLLRGAERGGANTRGRDLTRAVQASRHLLKVIVQKNTLLTVLRYHSIGRTVQLKHQGIARDTIR